MRRWAAQIPMLMLALAVFTSAPTARAHDGETHDPFESGAESSDEPTCEQCHAGKMIDTMRLDHSSPAGHADAPLPPEILGRVCASGPGGWALLLSSLAKPSERLAGCDRCHREGVTPPASADTAGGDSTCVQCHGSALELAAAGFGLQHAVEPDAEGTRCVACHVPTGSPLTLAGLASGTRRDVHLRDIDSDDAEELSRACFDCHMQASHRTHPADESVPRRHLTGAKRGETSSCLDARCHAAPVHDDRDIERHQEVLACAACHIPSVTPVRIDLTGNTPSFEHDEPERPLLRWVWERQDAAYPRVAEPPRQGGFRAKLQPFARASVRLPIDRFRPLPGTYDGALLVPSMLPASATGLETSGETELRRFDIGSAISLDHGIAPAADALTCESCHVESGGFVLSRLLEGRLPFSPYADGLLAPDFPEREPAEAHADLRERCDACHGSFRLDAVNLNCATAECHADKVATHQSEATRAGDEDCADCHREHRDRDSLTALAPAACLDSGCHDLSHGGTQLHRPADRGASLLRELAAQPVGLTYSHRAHLEILDDEGIDSACITCHEEDDDREFRMPSHEGATGCSGDGGCHAVAVAIEEARENPSRYCLECHSTRDGEMPELAPRSQHVRFSHRGHLEATDVAGLFQDGALDCQVCHVDDFDGNPEFDELSRQPGDYPLDMEACVDCHRTDRAADLRCESCHRYHFQTEDAAT